MLKIFVILFALATLIGVAAWNYYEISTSEDTLGEAIISVITIAVTAIVVAIMGAMLTSIIGIHVFNAILNAIYLA